MKNSIIETEFIEYFDIISEDINRNAVKKGFWENSNDAEKICLMHSEFSEALEGLRKGNPPDDKIPEFSSLEAEFADTIIRIMDYAVKNKLRLGQAIIAKMKFNKTRPYKHGKKF